MKTKGIILAGGSATRLRPLSLAICKQLMPIYDKPMIYYPLSTLLSAGINEILIITTHKDLERFTDLLGDGSQLGCRFTYAIQDAPRGIAEAFLIGQEFIGNDQVCLILGDNIFYGPGVRNKLIEAKTNGKNTIFAYKVSDPERYGVVDFDENGVALSIEEKPLHPKSSYAVPGIYFYQPSVVEVARNLAPSARGEIEITDISMHYLNQKDLQVVAFENGTAWLDTGTFDSMMQASNFIEAIEKRQGIKIGCIEEEAFIQGFLSREKLKSLAEFQLKSGYGEYLMGLL